MLCVRGGRETETERQGGGCNLASPKLIETAMMSS